MHHARSSYSLLIALTLAAACGPRNGDTDDIVLTTTGSSSSGSDGTVGVSTVTGVSTISSSSSSSSSSSTTDATDSDATDSSSSTTSSSVCGDGEVEGNEECDDGNDDDTDDCTNACLLPACGDGIVYKGVEQCDDGNLDDSDVCTSLCEDAKCGDGFVYAGFEACDDGNDDSDDACTNLCEVAKCGDGHVYQAGGEVCDDGQNIDDYGGCAPGCKKLGPRCGDDIVQKNEGERCDTSPPFANVTCNENCTYNFGTVTQLLCGGSCTWDDEAGCQQGDADIFCKLKLGSPTAKAKSFNANTNIGKPTNGSGFPCADPDLDIPGDLRINLGKLSEYGIAKPVFWQNKDILKTHGPGPTLIQIQCID